MAVTVLKCTKSSHSPKGTHQ